MRNFLVFILQIVVFFPLFSSCSDDEPMDSDGYIFLEHGKQYPALTQVADDEIMSKLCTGSWTLINGNNWLFYDKKHVSGWGAGKAGGDDFYFLAIKFNEDGTCGFYPDPELGRMSFTVKDRMINIENSRWNVKVVAIYQGNLVVDLKPKEEIKGFDTATLMQRYIWYYSESQE